MCSTPELGARAHSCLGRVALFTEIYFFCNDTATTEIYTLSLHDALPISRSTWTPQRCGAGTARRTRRTRTRDRKSTRLNSSHPSISYAVFCLKKKTSQFHVLFKSSQKKSTLRHSQLSLQVDASSISSAIR